MAYQAIKYEKEGGVCVITLNRPEALNAINMQMRGELAQAVEEISNDKDIIAVIFTGAPRPDGRPCFSAGADLKELAAIRAKTPAPSSPIPTLWSVWAQMKPESSLGETFRYISYSPKISIAAVDGVCTAGGIELATSCDIIFASETAQISDMHVKNLGIVGGAGVPANIAWRIGASRALELCCTGDVIDGKEAERIGLANRVFAPNKLLEGAKELARKIGMMRPAAIQMTKAVCRSVQDMDRRTSWYYNDAAVISLRSEPDAAEWGPARWVKQRGK